MSAKSNAILELLKHEHTVRINSNDRDYSYFHPSEFHECVRKIAYKFYGESGENNIKPDLQRIFDNGHYMHERFVSYFDNLGILYGVWRCSNPLCGKVYGREEKLGIKKPTTACTCTNSQYIYEEIEAKNKEYWLSGRVDALIWLSEEMAVIDFKSMNSNMFNKLACPPDKHTIQVSIYLWMLGLEHGYLLYENKDTQKIKVFEVTRNDNLIEKILKRATNLMRIIGLKKLPKRPFERSSNQCKNCQLKKTCWAKQETTK